MTVCTKCKQRPQRPGSTCSWCNHCTNEAGRKKWNDLPIEKRREKWLKTKFKLSWDDYERMFNRQKGRCSICDIDISITTSSNNHQTACVDHCHKTGKIRGLLCNHCNRALGLMKDSRQSIKRMLLYLGE